jgi:hypothetical protein
MTQLELPLQRHKLLTYQDLAARWQVTTRTIYNWKRKFGEQWLTACRFSSSSIRFSIDAVEAFEKELLCSKK